MVYVLFAEGFEETEAVVPVDFLRRAQIPVRMVSMNSDTLWVTGSHGICVQCEQTADGAFPDMEMLLLPGGMPGTRNLDEHPQMNRLLRLALERDCYLAAICAAPLILGRRGLLQKKKAVCYPGFELELTGAQLQKQRVVQDGKRITAIGPGAAIEFAYTVTSVLAGKACADHVLESLC